MKTAGKKRGQDLGLVEGAHGVGGEVGEQDYERRNSWAARNPADVEVAKMRTEGSWCEGANEVESEGRENTWRGILGKGQSRLRGDWRAQLSLERWVNRFKHLWPRAPLRLETLKGSEAFLLKEWGPAIYKGWD